MARHTVPMQQCPKGIVERLTLPLVLVLLFPDFLKTLYQTYKYKGLMYFEEFDVTFHFRKLCILIKLKINSLS